MKVKVILNRFRWILFMLLLFNHISLSQSLRDNLQQVFDEVLLPIDLGGRLNLGQFEHGRHFVPAVVEASEATITSFSNFISANISSFPLSSTAAGLTFDFSTGVPVATTTSLGPIFTERSQTLGRNRVNIGFNFSYLDLNKWRGVNTEDIRFTFIHDDFAGPNPGPPSPSGVIGDDRFGTEFDHIDLFLNLDFNASILAFSTTYGITNRLDIGVAIPFVTISMEGQPIARMNALSVLSSTRRDTLGNIQQPGSPTHFWGTDPDNPKLISTPTAVKNDAAGIGDIALRLKYNFIRGRTIDVSALAEYRFPTGDEEDFLGAGEPSYKGMLIFSSILGNFAPHLNLAFEHRGSEYDRDELEIFVGYDQKLTETVTIAVDFLGEFELGDPIDALRFPEPVVLQGSGPWADFSQEVSMTNLPNFDNDHIMNGAVGLKFTPKENLLVIGNVFVPLNNGGLRSNIVPTVGFEFTF